MPRGDIFVGIGANSIRIYDGHRKKEWRAEIPESLVEKLEVKDSEAYEKWWSGLFKKLDIHGRRILLVLDETTIFYKEVGSEADGEAFWKEVPLIPEKTSKNIIKRGEKFLAVATNTKLFEPIITVVEECKSVITGVYPDIAFIEKNPADILKTKEVSSDSNFLKIDTSIEDIAEKGISRGQIVMGGAIILIIILSAVIFVMLKKQTKSTPLITPIHVQVKNSPVPQILPSAIPTTSQIVEVDLTKVRVLVLNGSGIIGKAKEIADYLIDKGYKNVDTGNYKNISSVGIIIETVSNKVLTDRLFKDLSEDYKTATPEMDWKDNHDYDAVVIIGK